MRAIVTPIAFLLYSVGSLPAQTAPVLSAAVREYVTVDAPVTAITHVRLIDGTGGAVAEDQTIVLASGKIQAVGGPAAVQVPAGAKVMDLTGHTVVPGFIGLHDHTFLTPATHVVHLGFSGPRLYLSSGVTTIRTTGSPTPYLDQNLKQAIDDGRVPGPRMYITGPYLTGGMSGNPTVDEATHHLSSPEEARRTVAYWAEEGVSWFKAYTTFTRAELAAAIDEAH